MVLVKQASGRTLHCSQNAHHFIRNLASNSAGTWDEWPAMAACPQEDTATHLDCLGCFGYLWDTYVQPPREEAAFVYFQQLLLYEETGLKLDWEFVKSILSNYLFYSRNIYLRHFSSSCSTCHCSKHVFNSYEPSACTLCGLIVLTATFCCCVYFAHRAPVTVRMVSRDFTETQSMTLKQEVLCQGRAASYWKTYRFDRWGGGSCSDAIRGLKNHTENTPL